MYREVPASSTDALLLGLDPLLVHVLLQVPQHVVQVWGAGDHWLVNVPDKNSSVQICLLSLLVVIHLLLCCVVLCCVGLGWVGLGWVAFC